VYTGEKHSFERVIYLWPNNITTLLVVLRMRCRGVTRPGISTEPRAFALKAILVHNVQSPSLLIAPWLLKTMNSLKGAQT
jgi:hypothetical protein